MFINSPLVVANFTVKSHRGDLRVLKTTTNRSRIEPNVNLFQWRNSPERQVCTAAGAGRIGALPLDASRDVETAPRPPAVPRANRTEVNIFNIFSPKKMFSVFSFFFPPWHVARIFFLWSAAWHSVRPPVLNLVGRRLCSSKQVVSLELYLSRLVSVPRVAVRQHFICQCRVNLPSESVKSFLQRNNFKSAVSEFYSNRQLIRGVEYSKISDAHQTDWAVNDTKWRRLPSFQATTGSFKFFPPKKKINLI